MKKGTVIINGAKVDLDKIAEENRQYQAEDPEVRRTYAFVANDLRIHELVVQKINIQPHDSKQIAIEISGLQSEVDLIQVKEQSGVVAINNGDTGHSGVNIGGVNIQKTSSRIQINKGHARVTNIGNIMSFGNFGGGMTVISGDGDINIQTGDFASCSLEIRVPTGTDIELDGVMAEETVVGDTKGPLSINSSGEAGFTVGTVTDLNLDSSGVSKVDVQRVSGNVSVDLSGASSVKIHEGKIQKLNIDISGAGRADIQCTAERANLDVSGAGNIYVKHIMKEPYQKKSGIGQIRVGSIG